MTEVDALIAAIAGTDDAQRQLAWERLQERFEADLEGTVAASESALVRALDGGDAFAAAAVLAMLGAVTSRFPAVVLRADVLRRALAHATDLGPSAAVDVALQLARSEPATLIGPGLDYLLAVTEANLDRDDRVLELWRVLAEGDPASLPAIAEWEVARAYPRVQAYFAEQLAALAEAIPSLAAVIAGTLETMGAEPELAAVGEQVRRQRVASEIAQTAFPAEESAPSPTPDAASDPRVDELLDEFVTHRSYEALDHLRSMVDTPSPAFAGGLCEAIADLRAPPRDDEAAWQLAYLLALAVKRRPDVAPARAAAQLLEDDYLRADTTIDLLAVLAHADARLVDVERALHATLVQASHAAITDLWTCIARAHPEAMLAFAAAWWEREGWASELGRLLSSELVRLAAHAPAHADAVIRLLEAQVVPEPPSEPGVIRLSIDPKPEDDLARLRALRA